MAYPVISVDVMGGDHGPDVILDGIEKALVHRSDVRFLLFGNEEIVRPALARKRCLKPPAPFTLRHVGCHGCQSPVLRCGRAQGQQHVAGD